MFVTALAVLLLPAFAAAQYGGPNPTPTSSTPVPAPSAPPDTAGNMNIDVAFNGTFTFHPNNIVAPNGTLVTFWIPDQGFDHSITQSSFDAPCTYLNSSANSTTPGFDSGLHSRMKFTINITDDTKPIWFHCKQILHCGMGMVGSINAPNNTANTFEAFQAAAIKIGNTEVQETDHGFVAGGINAVATGPPVSSTSTSASSASNQFIVGTGFAMIAGVIALVLV
ncbi:hypothetical protein BDZ94DRAFT_1251922 [Collybia nuda]|uniref:Blue (type 1) copper domain-containing protein n=1 Tax=Collybia nuda TaxID=64659 RepID=A0A9P5YD15_9AGAR|nr:hypothetical protein BDZ94DRAFT_1251922 [Collybia nuda]